MPIPANQELYERAKKKIMKSYKKNSAFASGAIVKEYKQQGGKYIDDGEDRNLERWFDEKWININPIIGITDDDAYPTFRPTKRVNKKTPTTIQEIPKKRLKEQAQLKQEYKGKKNLPDFIVGGMIVKSNPFNLGNSSFP